MKLRYLVPSIALAIGLNCHASEWLPLDDTVSIDMASVVKSGQIVEIWVKRKFGPADDSTGGIKEDYVGVVRWRLDCATRRYAHGAMRILSSTGRVVTQNDGTPKEFHDSAPDTLSSELLSAFCTKSK